MNRIEFCRLINPRHYSFGSSFQRFHNISFGRRYINWEISDWLDEAGWIIVGHYLPPWECDSSGSWLGAFTTNPKKGKRRNKNEKLGLKI